MSDEFIDLRSDTVTRPSEGMRAAMAAAQVGDDQFADDPTVNALQKEMAALLGKEAALWFPTGTMANQVALKLLTRPGDDVVICRGGHAMWHETGGSAANSGVQFTEIGDAGVFTADEFVAVCKPRGHVVYPPTTLVEIENTHNRAGGVIFPHEEATRICEAAEGMDIRTYLDGSRLWNASVASGISMAEYSAPFDLVSVAFSKGLGAPGGSVMAGSRNLIQAAVRFRRMFGGAMRQIGIFAAAARYAIKHNVERLTDDHANAKRMAQILTENPRVQLDPSSVQTNILVFDIDDVGIDAHAVVAAARVHGVLIFAFTAHTLRAVTHMDVSRDQCEHAANTLCAILSS